MPVAVDLAKDTPLMGLLLLLVAHALVSAAGFALLWRRINRQRAEIAQLREMIAARSAPARKVRAADGAVVSISELAPHRPDRTVATVQPPRRVRKRDASLSPETARALTLALLAASPALGLFFEGAEAAVVASGLAIGAAMMVIALRPIWRVAAWASVLTVSVWSGVGFALGATGADPLSFSISLALAGVVGVVHAYYRPAGPGMAMTLLTAAAALALSSSVGLFNAPGAAYALIIAAAAIAGAMTLKLEAMHLAALGATVLGLFVFSGQTAAAIWFTPAAALAGALFLAIAAVRVPQLGPRGVAIAGTGAFAPLGAIAALHGAGHGLATPGAAAAMFVALAVVLGGILTLTAMRRPGGLAPMRLTLWVLSAGVFAAFVGAVSLALPGPLAAPAYAAFAAGLAALDSRHPSAAWRTYAVLALAASVGSALLAARALLAETGAWSPWLVALTTLIAPALLSGAAAYQSERSGARRTAATAEAAAFVLALAAAHVLLRLVSTGGATVLQEVTFVEAAAHASIWLAAALVVAGRSTHGAVALRDAAARFLSAAALTGILVIAVGWLLALWPPPPADAWLARPSLGFLLPAILLTAHWLYWRWRGAERRTRVAFAAASAAAACFLVLELLALQAAPGWTKSLGAAFALALALGGNFAPGITATGERLTLREKSPSQSAPQAAR